MFLLAKSQTCRLYSAAVDFARLFFGSGKMFLLAKSQTCRLYLAEVEFAGLDVAVVYFAIFSLGCFPDGQNLAWWYPNWQQISVPGTQIGSQFES